MKPRVLASGIAVVVLLAAGWFLGQRALDRLEPAATGATWGETPDIRDIAFTPEDRRVFDETMARARADRLDTLPLGQIVARLGRGFVGAPYTPGTLELPGPERLVVNLREFDCVTFVENMLAMARAIRAGTPDFGAYTAELRRIRYRDGVLNGYTSRLHYFSEWIDDAAAKGLAEPMSTRLGGVVDTAPVRFMSAHPGAYRQLSDPAILGAIRSLENRLSATPRIYIPEAALADAAPGIRSGDIIAATSTLEGLDVAHTGIALWVDGRLHLMHAPLVGRAVEISEHPLADRIRRIGTQDGVMVARPL